MKIFLLGGTTEGRLLAADLAAMGASVTVSVATPLGAEELAAIPGLTVLTGRMEVPAMAAALAGQDLCVDATHPYAAAASANIRAACEQAGVRRLRLARPESTLPPGSVLLPDADAAARFLAGQAGNILLATGANTVGCYRDLASRVWARVLPTAASLAACEAAGLAHSHILALQGPFSGPLTKPCCGSTALPGWSPRTGARRAALPTRPKPPGPPAPVWWCWAAPRRTARNIPMKKCASNAGR